jgi:hypothetical protein
MATQMTTAFSVQNGTAQLAFSHLCKKAPQTDPYDAGKYVTQIILQKGSKDESDFITNYQATAAEAKQLYGVDIPDWHQILFDGDAKNAERAAEIGSDGTPKKPYEFYRNAWYFKVTSKFPIPLFDVNGTEQKAFGPNGAIMKDGQYDMYYIPDLMGSKINFSVKFNVGIAVDKRTKQPYPFARPYIVWIQQCVPGPKSTGFAGPTAWKGAQVPTQAQNVPTQSPVGGYVPQQAPQTYQAPVQAPVQQYQPQVNQPVQQYQTQPQYQTAPSPNAPVAPQAQIPVGAYNDSGFYGDEDDSSFPYGFG